MRYRRNADNQLRKIERDYSSTGDRSLLIHINQIRRRLGMPPHDDARIIAANTFLLDAFPRLASRVTEFIDVYTDIPMILYQDEDMEEQHPLYDRLIGLTEEIEQLRDEWRVVSNEVSRTESGMESDSDYAALLTRHGLSPTQLGPEVELPEKEGDDFEIRAVSKHAYRKGYSDRVYALDFMFRVVCERASRIFRKLMAYGVVNADQMLEEEPEFAEDWWDSPIGSIDELMDKIEISYQEIGDVTLGLHPRPEAIEMFNDDWYQS
jgi:hypothetical protein